MSIIRNDRVNNHILPGDHISPHILNLLSFILFRNIFLSSFINEFQNAFSIYQQLQRND